jgi:hypothetical protein
MRACVRPVVCETAHFCGPAPGVPVHAALPEAVMTRLVIVVEKVADWGSYYPSGDVMSAMDYLR